MAITGTPVNNFLKKLIDGSNINLASGGDTIKAMLLDPDYVPDYDTHDFINDVSAEEIVVTGYTAGGATLANKTVTRDDTDNEAAADADNPTWTITGSVAFRYVALYKDTGTPATSPILVIFDMGETVSIINGTLTLTLNAEGYLNLTRA